MQSSHAKSRRDCKSLAICVLEIRKPKRNKNNAKIAKTTQNICFCVFCADENCFASLSNANSLPETQMQIRFQLKNIQQLQFAAKTALKESKKNSFVFSSLNRNSILLSIVLCFEQSWNCGLLIFGSIQETTKSILFFVQFSFDFCSIFVRKTQKEAKFINHAEQAKVAGRQKAVFDFAKLGSQIAS